MGRGSTSHKLDKRAKYLGPCTPYLGKLPSGRVLLVRGFLRVTYRPLRLVITLDLEVIDKAFKVRTFLTIRNSDIVTIHRTPNRFNNRNNQYLNTVFLNSRLYSPPISVMTSLSLSKSSVHGAESTIYILVGSS